MTGYFPDPGPMSVGPARAYMHEHEWTEVGAYLNPNGTWSALFTCSLCPDVGLGGHVGPIPPGYCLCGWVQRAPGRKRCEDCKRPLDQTTTHLDTQETR